MVTVAEMQLRDTIRRLMSDKANHWTDEDHAIIYSTHRPPYQDVVVPWAIDLFSQPISLAVDVACGPGQVTAALSPHCTKVLGIDISDAMLKAARTHRRFPNVEYLKGDALSFSQHCPSHGVDLVTVGESVQFFDCPEFYAEVAKVLKPGGVLALVGYMFRGFEVSDREELSWVMKKFLQDEIYDPELTKMAKSLFDQYRDLNVPFEGAIHRTDTFVTHVTKEQVKGMFLSNPHLFRSGVEGVERFATGLPDMETLPLVVDVFASLSRV